MVSRSRFLGVVLAVMLCLPVAVQAAPTYSGSVSVDGDSIVANNNWDAAVTNFSWDITDQGAGVWFYDYSFTVPNAPRTPDISHLILQVSENFTANDYWGLWSNVGLEAVEIKDQDPDTGNSNPGMPGSVYAFKFDLDDDTRVFEFSFYSYRTPMLGDFYAKGGSDTFAYNFAFGDGNNSYDVADPVFGKIVVPNTHVVVPAPGAILLAGIGTSLVGWLRRRQSI